MVRTANGCLHHSQRAIPTIVIQFHLIQIVTFVTVWRDVFALTCSINYLEMKTMDILVENIKCGGCMNSIKSALMKMDGVEQVEISKEEDKVSLMGEMMNRDQIILKLAALGYPEKGNNSLLSKAKSMVSCAVGRISE